MARLLDLENCTYLTVPGRVVDRMFKSGLLLESARFPASSFQLLRRDGGRGEGLEDWHEGEEDEGDGELLLQPGVGWHELGRAALPDGGARAAG